MVKHPKGIGLNNSKTISRKDDIVGISTSRFGDSWLVTRKGRALFKAYNMETQGIRVVNELLYDELANQIGLPVAQYLPANYKQTDNNQKNKNPNLKQYFGLASIDVTNKNERILTGYELLTYDESISRINTFQDYIQALDYYRKKEGCTIDRKGIESTLFKMMVLDTLTFNEDRHANNVSFIKNDKENYLIPSPVIDNELCFFGKNLWLYWSKKLKHIDSKNLLTKYGNRLYLVVDKQVYDFPNKYVYEENVKAIVKLATKSKNMQKFLNNTLENIDINKAFENVEKKGYKVTPEYKCFVNNLMSISTDMFKKYVKESDMHKQENQENQL